MKRLLYIFLSIAAVLFTFTISRAHTKVCNKIIVNNSLFNKQSDEYNFDILTDNLIHSISKDHINDINEVIVIDADCISFRISYGCGCGANEKKLVTNGLLHQDTQGNHYYEIKLLFTNQNNGCKSPCHDELAFDIEELKNQQMSIYIKFVGFDQLIKYK